MAPDRVPTFRAVVLGCAPRTRGWAEDESTNRAFGLLECCKEKEVGHRRTRALFQVKRFPDVEEQPDLTSSQGHPHPRHSLAAKTPTLPRIYTRQAPFWEDDFLEQQRLPVAALVERVSLQLWGPVKGDGR